MQQPLKHLDNFLSMLFFFFLERFKKVPFRHNAIDTTTVKTATDRSCTYYHCPLKDNLNSRTYF